MGMRGVSLVTSRSVEPRPDGSSAEPVAIPMTSPAPAARAVPGPRRTDLRTLVGSGDRIGLFTLPFLVVGLAMNARNPSPFAVGVSSRTVRAGALAMLACGVLTWAWSAVLILTKVPRGELITGGPYAVVKHPLYTSVALLVLPSAGLLRHTWLGALIGAVMYAGSRRFAPAEEAALSATFGAEWESYRRNVMVPWL